MKKRPFILVELLISIAILSLCAIPLMGYPYFSYKRQKKQLLEIEKQRQAEILFYDLLKTIDEKYTWDTIDRKFSKQKDSKTLILNIDGFGEIPLKVHHHLYHCHPDIHEDGENKNNRKIWCAFCFEEPKMKCDYKKEKTHPYKFVFFAEKRVEENKVDESKEG